ncbi:threonine ammonia-lyase [Anaerocolumna cellulosilytica]|uniref:threonine ammonia-lyase n=1 Tax=Anaerocolumna cellulosilytica TaxID=433286 RepID=A0A6S6QZA9_9FIRM|nr:threonine ammonia-lyase [Anaerocolumna cellulosilytica]MBB5197581.1 threonine dehydratase [Anaerocolumna cellulosilytica]BCJ95106.1 threonine ammonia-lyase [Anaerocolumna cellulosilytica]
MMTLDKFEEAAELVKKVTLRTKLIYSDYFSDTTGNKVFLKPENMQFTGAYKVRGAYYKISTLTEEEREKGLITASAGNHAQGVAYAAKMYQAKAVIVMPTTTPLIKVNRTKGYGAEVILHGDVYDDACQYALQLAEEKGYTFIHPFDDEVVSTGQGTIAMEIFQELPTVDVILVPIGGGGLAAGVSTLAKLLNPNIKVIGVEPMGANCMQESIKAGQVVTLHNIDTIADGTAVKTPGSNIFPYIQKNIDEVISIDDHELIVSFLDMIENHKMVVENSGLLTVAALKHLDFKNKKVVSILSGGNMDVITVSSIVQHGLIQRGRIFTVSVLLPDRPGELVNVANVIAASQGNVIRLDHNQFVSINRNSAVELTITMEAFGHEHKESIVAALKEKGYNPKIVQPKGTYN